MATTGPCRWPKKGKHGAPKVLDTEDISVQDGWQAASDANADLRLAGDELNPHFTYDDEDDHVRHQVWMLDAVTALNELRAARQMGLQTFALWRLGEEDPSLWSIWDHPSNLAAPQSLKQIPPGDDVDYRRRRRHPAHHRRTASGLAHHRHGLLQLDRDR